MALAAAPLAAWVKANLEYSAVLIRIQPLMDENDRLQADLTVQTAAKAVFEASLKDRSLSAKEKKDEMAQFCAELAGAKAGRK